MDSIRFIYGDTNSPESDDNGDDNDDPMVTKMFNNDQRIELLEQKLSKAKEKREMFTQQLKEIYLASASTSEILRSVIKYFDDTGEFLGIEDCIIRRMGDSLPADADEVVEVVREAVLKLITNSYNYPAVRRRRWNLHLLAVILQLKQFESVAEELELLFRHVVHVQITQLDPNYVNKPCHFLLKCHQTVVIFSKMLTNNCYFFKNVLLNK